MSVSQPFHSSHNIGGAGCDFPSKEELLGYLEHISPPHMRGSERGSAREKLTHIVTLNAEMVVEAQHNEQFRNAIKKAEIVIPDGSSMLWAREYLQQRAGKTLGVNEKTPRVKEARKIIFSLIKFFFSKYQPLPGVDIIFDICEILEKKEGTVYLLGGKQHEAQKTAEILRKKYPELNVSITSPSPSFVRRGNAAIFVALGSPKQSLWIEQHRTTLENAGIHIAMGVGGAFAMIAGTLPRAPHWMRQHHLEWLWRLILEPHRIKRIWNAVVVFPKLIYKTTR